MNDRKMEVRGIAETVGNSIGYEKAFLRMGDAIAYNWQLTHPCINLKKMFDKVETQFERFLASVHICCWEINPNSGFSGAALPKRRLGLLYRITKSRRCFRVFPAYLTSDTSKRTKREMENILVNLLDSFNYVVKK